MKDIFLDLGDGTSIPRKKVVLILNAESATVGVTTRRFLKTCSQKGASVLPKKALWQVNSLVLCNSYGKDSLYSSSRSARLLAGKDAK